MQQRELVEVSMGYKQLKSEIVRKINESKVDKIDFKQ